MWAMPNGECQRHRSHRKIQCFISEHMASGSGYTVFDTPFFHQRKRGVIAVTTISGATAPPSAGGVDAFIERERR